MKRSGTWLFVVLYCSKRGGTRSDRKNERFSKLKKAQNKLIWLKEAQNEIFYDRLFTRVNK
jgi:hypothetical protein